MLLYHWTIKIIQIINWTSIDRRMLWLSY